jgi:dsRNA-specific ribonuclease
VEVEVGQKKAGRGQGRSKQEAAQRAATAALEAIRGPRRERGPDGRNA